MTAIENILARMNSYREEIDARVDKLSSVTSQPSAFAALSGKDTKQDDLLAAAAAGNVAGALAHLQAMNEPVGSVAPPGSPFRESAPTVIDGEFTAITQPVDPST